MTQKIIIAGFGGQGVLLIGQIIAYAGMYEGKEVTWMPSYGPEMRGGTANCSVVISEKRISSPVVAEAATVVVMNLPSMVKFEKQVKSGGKLFINSSLIKEKSSRKDIEIYNVDANTIASKLKNDKVANMVMLGAVLNKTNLVKPESIEMAMIKYFTGKKAELISLNKRALTAWNREFKISE